MAQLPGNGEIRDYVENLFGPWENQRRYHVGGRFPGVHMRGQGLFECVQGQLTSFMIKLDPALRSLPITVTLTNDATDEIFNLNYIHVHKFGYRVLYTIHTPEFHFLTVTIGTRTLEPIRITYRSNWDNYWEDVRSSHSILLATLQRSSEENRYIHMRLSRMKQLSRRTLRSLQTTAASLMNAVESSQIASDACTESVNSAMELDAEEPESERDSDLSDSDSGLDEVFPHDDDDDGDQADDEDDGDDDDGDEQGDGEDPHVVLNVANEPPEQELEDVAVPIDGVVEQGSDLSDHNDEPSPQFSGVKRRLVFESDTEVSEDSPRRRRSMSEPPANVTDNTNGLSPRLSGVKRRLVYESDNEGSEDSPKWRRSMSEPPANVTDNPNGLSPRLSGVKRRLVFYSDTEGSEDSPKRRRSMSEPPADVSDNSTGLSPRLSGVKRRLVFESDTDDSEGSRKRLRSSPGSLSHLSESSGEREDVGDQPENVHSMSPSPSPSSSSTPSASPSFRESSSSSSNHIPPRRTPPPRRRRSRSRLSGSSEDRDNQPENVHSMSPSPSPSSSSSSSSDDPPPPPPSRRMAGTIVLRDQSPVDYKPYY